VALLCLCEFVIGDITGFHSFPTTGSGAIEPKLIEDTDRQVIDHVVDGGRQVPFHGDSQSAGHPSFEQERFATVSLLLDSP